MVKRTKRWKHFHNGMLITNIIHFLIGLAPILALCIAGWCSGTIGMANKLSLGIFGTAAVALLIFETCKKIKLRTMISTSPNRKSGVEETGNEILYLK